MHKTVSAGTFKKAAERCLHTKADKTTSHTEVLHVTVEDVRSSELDLRVFGGQVGHDGGHGHGNDRM